MPTCNNCGEFVSNDFARVFGNEDDEVFGCINCLPFRARDSFHSPDVEPDEVKDRV